jgi:hypothetical protein
MSLWFAGARQDRAGGDLSPSSRLQGYSHRSNLELGTLESQVEYRPHGRRRVDQPSDTGRWLMTDVCEASATASKPPKRHIPASPSKSYEKVFTKTPPKASPAPYALQEGTCSDRYVGQKKRVAPVPHPKPTDGDAFVLKRSRTPPPGARFQESTAADEGVGVLLASSLRQKGNVVLVRPHSGRLHRPFEDVVRQQRAEAERVIEAAHADKCMRAREVEQQRMTAIQGENVVSRRAMVTPASARSTEPPFALGMPCPTRDVGRSCIKTSLRRSVF